MCSTAASRDREVAQDVLLSAWLRPKLLKPLVRWRMTYACDVLAPPPPVISSLPRRMVQSWREIKMRLAVCKKMAKSKAKERPARLTGPETVSVGRLLGGTKAAWQSAIAEHIREFSKKANRGESLGAWVPSLLLSGEAAATEVFSLTPLLCFDTLAWVYLFLGPSLSLNSEDRG